MTDQEMAAELKAKGWKIEEPWTAENCKHPPHMIMGSGGMSADGSCHSSWHCRQCGKSDSWVTPPSPNHIQSWPQNALR